MGTPGAWCSISGYHCKKSIGQYDELDTSKRHCWQASGELRLAFLIIFSKISYLGLYVVETRRRDNAEANEEHVGLRVAEWAQAVVVLLTGCVPESQADGLVVDHDARRVVVEDGRDVLAREGVGGVGDEQARLADGTVAGDDAFQRLRGWSGHVGWCVRVDGRRSVMMSRSCVERYYAVRSLGGAVVGGAMRALQCRPGWWWYGIALSR